MRGRLSASVRHGWPNRGEKPASFALQDPASPYQVMARKILPASPITGINSDLPGQVIAQVAEHVYGTPTDRFVLILQAPKIIGR